jgi:TPR repeat protein
LKSKYETVIAHYFEMTAREEDSEGQILYDSCLYNRLGVQKDLMEAPKYFQKAREVGNIKGSI